MKSKKEKEGYIVSKCDEYELNKKLKICAHRFYTHKVTNNSEKKLLTDLVVIVDDKHYITRSFAQSNQLKEELFLFDQGDEQNEYTIPCERTLNGKKVKSLELKINETETIYLSKSASRSIATMLKNALVGFSLTSLRSRDLRDAYSLYLKDQFEGAEE